MVHSWHIWHIWTYLDMLKMWYRTWENGEHVDEPSWTMGFSGSQIWDKRQIGYSVSSVFTGWSLCVTLDFNKREKRRVRPSVPSESHHCRVFFQCTSKLVQRFQATWGSSVGPWGELCVQLSPGFQHPLWRLGSLRQSHHGWRAPAHRAPRYGWDGSSTTHRL